MKRAGLTVSKIISSTFSGLSHLLWPDVCDNCNAATSQVNKRLCNECWQSLLACLGGDYCERCGKEASKYGQLESGCPNCNETEIHFDNITRAGLYESTLRDMILSFKFNDRTELGHVFSMLASPAVEACRYSNQIEMFVPVPLHWRRRFERGYNQSHIICKAIKHPAKINTDLVRVRNTERQWNLTTAKRKRNVAGAFAVRRGHGFKDKTICLVDDITTSGATLNECAKTLKEAGAGKVITLVIAVAAQNTNN